MIRLIIIWNLVVTACLAVVLMSNRQGNLSKTQLQAGVPQPQPDVLRVRRVEIVDQQGRLTAVLGQQSELSTGGLSLLDSAGRKVVVLALNDRGYGTLYFGSKQMDGKVSVGYFAGGDQAVPLSEEDPLGGWGIRVIKPEQGSQVFGVQGDGQPIPTSR